METAWIILFSAAITVVFTEGSIFKVLREHGPKLWRELVSCALCSGVWIGTAMWLLSAGFPHAGDSQAKALYAVTALGTGCLTGCLALLFVLIWEKLDQKA